MKEPEKSQGQTDRRILGLSFKDFKDEFGFKPDDKIEPRHFATNRERLTDPLDRERAVRMDRHRKAAAERRAEIAAERRAGQ